MTRLCLLLPLLLGGCILQNMSTETHLRDAVEGLNDSLRWNRMDLAVERVEPRFRNEFSQRHHLWGGRIVIADSEVKHVQVAEDRSAAFSIVAVRWYARSSLVLHQTVIRQHWKRAGQGFALSSERIVNGDDRLLNKPEPKTKKTGDAQSSAAE